MTTKKARESRWVRIIAYYVDDDDDLDEQVLVEAILKNGMLKEGMIYFGCYGPPMDPYPFVLRIDGNLDYGCEFDPTSERFERTDVREVKIELGAKFKIDGYEYVIKKIETLKP